MAERTIDAVRVPLGHAKGRTPQERVRAIAAEFAPLLGGGKVWIRHQQSFIFVAPESKDTLLFPTGHALARRDRYTWTDRGDGVMFGTLAPDEAEAGPTEDERRAMTEATVGKLRAARAGVKAEADRAGSDAHP